MDTILGIDGGATSTNALLSDQTEHILGRGLGGPSNYNVVGKEAATVSLNDAIEGALAEAQCDPRSVEAAVLGVAYRDEPAPFSDWFASRLPNAKTMVVPDYELILPAGTPDGWGVAIISGTGSVAFGRDPEESKALTGGWGYILGDEGSGYAIGLAALRALTRAHDDRGPNTMLTEMVFKEWSLVGVEDLCRRVYHEGTTHADIAALAPLVNGAAEAGDGVALNLLKEAGSELALAIMALVSQLNFPQKIPCAQAGSVLLKSDFVAEALLQRVKELQIPLEPIQKVSEPVFGALWMARELLTENG